MINETYDAAEYQVARDYLAERLATCRDAVEEANPELAGFEGGGLADDLLTFINLAEPDVEDAERCLGLAVAGKFSAWACPTCGDDVYEARLDGDAWGDFQGVRGIQEFSSYPGKGRGDRRCDACRCHMVGDATYEPDADD